MKKIFPIMMNVTVKMTVSWKTTMIWLSNKRLSEDNQDGTGDNDGQNQTADCYLGEGGDMMWYNTKP
jgi:hypothetical protein